MISVKGPVRFRIGKEKVVLYARRDESLESVTLRAVGYALFRERVADLEIDPKLNYKYPADLAACDLRGEPYFLAICGDLSLQRLEWTCRHVPAPELALLAQVEDAQEWVARIRRAVHYRYTHHRLVLYNVIRPVDEWVDQDDLQIPDEYVRAYPF